MTSIDDVREQVRSRYAAAAQAVGAPQEHAQASGPGCCTPEALDHNSEVFGSGLYADAEQGELPTEALLASLGCGAIVQATKPR